MARRLLGALCGLLLAVGVQAQPLQVLTSIRPLALIAQDLVGAEVRVAVLVPAHADPHSWSMRVSDRQRLAQADLVVWLGPQFERFLQRPMASRAEAQLVVGDLEGLRWPALADASSHGHAHSHDHAHDHHDHGHAEDGRDLHLWLDPHNVAVILQALAERLTALRPDLAPQIRARLPLLLAQLAERQADAQQRLSPLRDRGFAVYHDAYGHFVGALGLRQVGAVNQLPEQQLSARRLRDLQVQMAGARCLLVEREFEQGRRLAQALKVPMVVADALALAPELKSYGDFFEALVGSFERCLQAQ